MDIEQRRKSLMALSVQQGHRGLLDVSLCVETHQQFADGLEDERRNSEGLNRLLNDAAEQIKKLEAQLQNQDEWRQLAVGVALAAQAHMADPASHSVQATLLEQIGLVRDKYLPPLKMRPKDDTKLVQGYIDRGELLPPGIYTVSSTLLLTHRMSGYVMGKPRVGRMAADEPDASPVTPSLRRVWACSCGWSGNSGDLEPTPAGGMACPKCGGSGGLTSKGRFDGD